MIDQFGFGSKMPERESLPDIKEVLNALKAVHEKALNHLKAMKDEELEEQNLGKVAFGGDDSKRMIIHHVIRHEAVHAGHLSLIAKMHGVKTV